ncbi:amidase [Humitalea sp. 24SJ18S-53]|uniref:amidase n=1 Tax=Humitalea sp. 24SJ18S-53 TaxID=3422307 RepID=UPI003D665C88
MQPWELTATAAAAKLQDGSLTAEALTRSCLDRIAAQEPAVKAWIFLDPVAAIAKAREVDKAAIKGCLHGLPIGVKDMIDTADMPTTHNSPIYQGLQQGRDAACVGIARAEGAVILGKTDTVEFAAAGRRALTRNPHDLTRTPGGSSSGSAAAVAAGMVPLAFGTQTGGSTIRPGSFCGIYAMKPTHGVVNSEGAKRYSHTLDTIGWYGRAPSDLRLLAEAFRLFGLDVPLGKTVKDLRIGLLRGPNWHLAAPESQAALLLAGKRLADAGVVVEEVTLPAPFDGITEAQRIVLMGEGRGAFLAEYVSAFGKLHADFRSRVENESGITAAMMAGAYDLAGDCRRSFDAIASGYDAVLTPAAPGEAPVGRQDTGNAVFNSMWTLLHVPCIGIPCTEGPNGLPVGVQIIGQRFGDAALLDVAALVAPVIDPKLPG